MAKILVTGGAGFIGSHVADAYLAAGHAVAVVDNLVAGSKENVPAGASFHPVDIRSEELGAIFAREKPEYVAHLAAQIDVRRSLTEPLFDAEVNILGSLNVLEQSVAHGVRKFIFSSTGGAIYGDPKELPATEECPPNPKCHYATSKLAFEFYLHLYRTLYELPYAILRFPNVYGPRQSPEGEAGVCSILTGLMLRGQQPTLYGFGTPLRDYVYVGDIARAAVLALDKGDCVTLNLGSGRGTSVRELFDIIRELVGYEGEPVLAALRPGEVEQNYISGERAAAVLGWHPEVDLREGLRRTVAHIREQFEKNQK